MDVILPYRDEIIDDHATKFSQGSNKNYDFHRKDQKEQWSVSGTIYKWIYKQFNPNSPDAQKQFNIKPNEKDLAKLETMFDLERNEKRLNCEKIGV